MCIRVHNLASLSGCTKKTLEKKWDNFEKCNTARLLILSGDPTDVFAALGAQALSWYLSWPCY